MAFVLRDQTGIVGDVVIKDESEKKEVTDTLQTKTPTEEDTAYAFSQPWSSAYA
jgi:hypothetical protein